ncbi:MAG: septal ring lytic transglycosylase RlpA family protein [Deltaproteobacteria bacterium]|nr:septal ring lytic transglycosylase RlpA family protein [Deltaproteobacteria bacterium]
MKQAIKIYRILGVLLAVLLVASCAPSSHVIDTPETKGRKYWEKPYVVAGQRYDPLLDCQEFTEEGMASWYGRDFHGRKTSNGEIYNMHAMTAAHKTLPLGVFVRVKNLRNGKEAVVRVNDRGPFVKGRIIDLSYSAAKKIGIVGPGTAPVRIEMLGVPTTEPATQKVAYQAPPPTKKIDSFAVQVAAFAAPENARYFADRVKPQFGPASIQTIEVDGKTFYRVCVGSYPDLESAEKARLRIQHNGFPHSFVVAYD